MLLPKVLEYKTRLWSCWVFHGGIRRACRFRIFPRFRIDGGIHFYWLGWAGWITVNRRKLHYDGKNSS